jgi:hypothetical protein
MVRRRRRKVNFQTGRNQANEKKDWGKTCYVHHVARGSHTQQKAILYMQTKKASPPVTIYHVFDRKSDAIVVIGLIPGSGPQSNEGFGVVPAVGVLLSCTDFA